jgi:hypothetical protein
MEKPQPHNYDKVISDWKNDADSEMSGLEFNSYEYKITRSRVLKQYKKISEVWQYIRDTYPVTKFPWGKWVNGVNNDLHGGLDKVLIILKYLYDHSMSKEETIDFLSKHQSEPKQGVVIFYCEDYNEMAENLKADNLNIKPRSIQRYLRWLKNYKFIYVLPQEIEHRNHNIFMIGDWIAHKGITRKRMFFVQQHKTRKKDFLWRKHYENAFRSFKDTFPRTS